MDLATAYIRSPVEFANHDEVARVSGRTASGKSTGRVGLRYLIGVIIHVSPQIIARNARSSELGSAPSPPSG